MDVQGMLNSVYSLDRDVMSKTERLNHLRRMESGLSGGGTPQPHTALARLQQLCRELDGAVVKLLDEKQEIAGRIEQVEEAKYRTVLQLRYLCGCTWEEIAEKMSFSCVHVQRIHRKALQELERCCGRL